MKIVITGASRGIGLATARQLDNGDNELALVASTEESFKDSFKNAKLYGADLSEPKQIDELVQKLTSDYGEIDVLINIAGNMVIKKFVDTSDEEISQLLDVNLRSHILITRKLLPMLKKSNKAQIVFMSSMAAKVSIVGESVYSATKSGITNFANVLRNELGPKIRVSAVHAWGVCTWGPPNPEDFIQPSDVAEAMEFIITRSDTVMVESIDLSNPKQWRGGEAPWSPK